MIKNKKDLEYYLACDKVALKIPDTIKRPRTFDWIWKYERLLRYTEFYWNSKDRLVNKLFYEIYRIRFKRCGLKLGFTIPLNVFGPGLSIAHYGTIVVNENAQIGENCRIHEGVTIGSTNGSPQAATIGRNCFIGSGAKIIGNVRIADDVAIGAGAVVVHDILSPQVAVGGVPAKIISRNGSSRNVIEATSIINDR